MIYSVCKGGIDALARNLAIEFREKMVRVNTILPGGFTNNHYKDKTPNWKAKLKKRQIFTPENIADIVLFLLDDKSCSINGESIFCDGGLHAFKKSSSDF